MRFEKGFWFDITLECKFTLALTPALSPEEREKRNQSRGILKALGLPTIFGNGAMAKCK